MKKCTLCVDKIYNETLPEAARVPACVSTCPAGARHFGDLGDPDSDISQLVEERGGYALMPEQGCKPTNRYLPPRPKDKPAESEAAAVLAAAGIKDDGSAAAGFLARMVDRALSR